MTTGWEYAVHAVKNFQVAGLHRTLDRYGRGGWELISMTTTVKTWVNLTGNDLVLVFKRPTDTPADLTISGRWSEEFDPATGLPLDPS